MSEEREREREKSFICIILYEGQYISEGERGVVATRPLEGAAYVQNTKKEKKKKKNIQSMVKK